jgi:hypothetical protein
MKLMAMDRAVVVGKSLAFHAHKEAPYVYQLEDFEPEEIARQLCLIDFDLWSLITERELLKYTKTKKKLEDCPNVVALVDRFNDVSLWVGTFERTDGFHFVVTSFFLLRIRNRQTLRL